MVSAQHSTLTPDSGRHNTASHGMPRSEEPVDFPANAVLDHPTLRESASRRSHSIAQADSASNPTSPRQNPASPRYRRGARDSPSHAVATVWGDGGAGRTLRNQLKRSEHASRQLYIWLLIVVILVLVILGMVFGRRRSIQQPREASIGATPAGSKRRSRPPPTTGRTASDSNLATPGQARADPRPRPDGHAVEAASRGPVRRCVFRPIFHERSSDRRQPQNESDRIGSERDRQARSIP